ncbi:FkbM family methyltransferase [Ponticoccus sp. (in: a-proteobacteria)]|uniref:FkbM family methyltransferase n=1 Tax=Ponticoccus sp. (in: a-proteobacteria) TaxID=1925025 RepID=UPI003AB54573
MARPETDGTEVAATHTADHASATSDPAFTRRPEPGEGAGTAETGSAEPALAPPVIAKPETSDPKTAGAETPAPGPHAPARNPFLISRGMKIPKHPDLTRGRVRGALKQGTYERKECDAVLRVVRPGDRVLELGGGIGYMSTLLSVKAGAAHVTSYEANPALIPYIRSVHAANGVTNVDLRNALLSPEPGDPVPFYIRRNFLASSMDPSTEKDAITQEVAIDRQALAPVLAEVRPDVLVCDIEGAEATLLPAGDWSDLRAAVIELHPQWIGQSGVQAVFDAMMRAGLTYFPKASEAKVVTFLKGW